MSFPEFVYTTLLKPRPLRMAANAVLRAIIPESVVRHGATIFLNPNDPVVSGALTLNLYEHQETEMFLSFCRPEQTVLDIGANVGYYTALTLSRIGPKGRVVSLEPSPEAFPFLLKTVAANNGKNITTCVPKAAAAEASEMQLYNNPDNRGDNRLYAPEFGGKACTVETVSVDSLLDSLNIDHVDLIKIDVQGFEGHVFAGMRKTILRSPNLTLLAEFWPYGLRSAGTDPLKHLENLEGLGLRLHTLSDSGLKPLLDKQRLIDEHDGRKYTTIVGIRNVS